MKKPAFIITEIFLSLVLVASAGAAVVLTADIRSGGAILPQQYFTAPGKESANQTSTEKTSSKAPESSAESAAEAAKDSKPESSVSEKSKTEESSKDEGSKTEESKPSATKTLSLQLEEPSDLSEQPKELTKLVNNYGYDYETLGFDKLIVVDKSGESTAKIYCYQKSSKGYWWDIAGSGKALTDKGFIGSEGVDFDVKPGSKQTPLGFYPITEGFYIESKPDTTFPMFKITEDTYWVTDTKSKYYNQHVEGTDDKDWSSADHMISSPDSYSCGLIVDFNTDKPADTSLAGGIFVHVGNAPTEGCIAMPETELRAIAEWLDGNSSCYIFIT